MTVRDPALAMRRLDGTVAVVTGAARGIGHSIAELFLREGARVACLDASASRLPAAVAGLDPTGSMARPYLVDVGRRDAVRQAFDEIEADFGAPIGILVNNAAWVRFQPIDQIDEETLGRILDVGLKGLVWTIQAAAPQMRRRGSGSIINLCSTAAIRALTDSVGYAAMKAGVAGLTRAAAVELSRDGIRVNTIVPGMIGTDASLANYDPAILEARIADMPLRRFGEPGEIARAALFLASQESSYVQGAELVVDGGWTISAS